MEYEVLLCSTGWLELWLLLTFSSAGQLGGAVRSLFLVASGLWFYTNLPSI